MEPSFQQIAELFALPIGAATDDSDVITVRQVGKTSEESAELAAGCLSEGDYEGAISHFQKAIEQSETDSPELRMKLASAYEYADREQMAFRQYAKALRTGPEAAESRLGLSDLYRRNGHFKDAVKQLIAASEAEPENAFLKFKLAEAYREMGDKPSALEAGLIAIELNDREAFYHYWIGDLLIAMQRPDDALKALRVAIELSPGDDFLYLRAAVAFWQAGRHQESLKAIRLASDLDPEKHLYHGLLEVLLEEVGESDAADQETERADKMDRFDLDLLARTLAEMGISAG